MRVFVKDTAVRADVAGLVVLLFADGCHAARREPRGAGADELGETAAEFEFGFGGVQVEFGLEHVVRLLQVFEGVFFDEAQKGGVESIRFGERGDVLVLEEHVFVLVQVDDHEAEDLAEIEAGDHLFEGLLAGAGGGFVDDVVVGGERENNVVVVEGAVFAVDGHGHVGGKVEVGDLFDGAAVFHVGGVAAGAEDAADAHGRVGVGRGDEGAGRVVDEGGEGDWEVLKSSQ